MSEATSETSAAATIRAPYAVGVVHTVIARTDAPDRSLPTEIWYPALPPAGEGARASHPLGLPYDAFPDLVPIAGPCPLVVFSHGNSGYRQQSTFLTTRLARAGFVVAAPDHVGNTFPEMLALKDEEARRAVHREIRRQRPADLHAVLRALLDAPANPADDAAAYTAGQTAGQTTGETAGQAPIRRATLSLPALDPTRIASLGHSFGGWTALKLPALDRRIRAVCALAPVSEPFVGRRAFEPQELPLPAEVHTLVIAARDDVLVDLETSLLPLFTRLGPSASLDILDDADHFHFCDGIELLHRMHESNPRPGQRRPTRPFEELRGERETQTLLADRILAFFSQHLA